MRTAITVVVVLVAGPPLPLIPAVARIVSHCYYSSFCAERVTRLWPERIVDRRSGLGIGIDSTACAELASVQARCLLEPDNHLTIRLPPLFIDIVGQVPLESARREARIGPHFLEVVHTEGNDVLVGHQKAIPRERPDAAVGLAAQQGFHLLRNDRSAE